MEPSLQKAGGSGLQTSEKMSNIGQKIVLVGLVLQAVSYGFFCLLLAKSHISIKSSGPFQIHRSCIRLIWVLYFSSVFISVRLPSFVSKWPSLNPPVDSLYLSYCGVRPRAWWLPPYSRRQVCRLGVFFPYRRNLQENSLPVYLGHVTTPLGNHHIYSLLACQIYRATPRDVQGEFGDECRAPSLIPCTCPNSCGWISVERDLLVPPSV